VDRQDGAPGVVFVIKKRPELRLLQVLVEPADPGLGFRPDAFAFSGELREDFELLFLAEDLPEELDILLEALFFLLEGLGSLLILPDFGGSQAQVNGIPLGVFAI
jgi:hypothetical protein